MTVQIDKLSHQKDGRRRRSERNKQSIVAAITTLIRRGSLEPSAMDVAQEAGVGVRTVFRLFEDMDALYGEMARQIQAEVMPIIDAPFENDDWRARCFEACERRAEIYEAIMMVRLSANARRSRSAYLRADYAMFLGRELDRLTEILPSHLRENSAFVYALDAAISFDTWCRLRRGRDLSVAKSKEVVRLTVEKLIAGL
ncbi:MAG: TetR/AcrR family transcriptional regulator [Pseudomonadota bacterium]